MSEESKDIYDSINTVAEFSQLDQFMDDEDIGIALRYVIQLIVNPDLDPADAGKLVVKITAMSNKFKMQAKFYMGLGKSQPDAAAKKNIYFSMAEEMKELAGSLKYLVRGNF